MNADTITNLFKRTIDALNNDDISAYQRGMAALGTWTDRESIGEYSARKADLMLDMLSDYADLLDEEEADRKARAASNGGSEYRMDW